MTIFDPGRNCLGVFSDSTAQVLVDAEDYFKDLERTMSAAKRSIYIAGWAIDPRVWLLADERAGQRTPLEHLVRRLVSENPDLHVYVLIWDVARAFMFANQPWAFLRKRWLPSRRITFKYDAEYPAGGCHHQKFVVVDEAVAFVGGIDLTVGRWDSREHLPTDRRRIDAYGVEHRPFHEAQMRVEGEAARAVAQVFRERWARVEKKPLPQHAVRAAPSSCAGRFIFEGADVALARTDPLPEEAPNHEIEALFLDMIAAARECIYIENQYLTDRTLGVALAERLKEDDGPEVILIGPRETANWMEELTVGLLRWRVIDMLREADRFGRLRILYPMASVADDVMTYLHIKLTIIDDVFVRVGSANISRRSMRIDTELDACVESVTDAHRTMAVELRNSLIAEHFAADEDHVTALWAEYGRVGPVIDALVADAGDHTLVVLGEGPAMTDRLLAQDADLLFDPEQPIEFAAVVEAFVGRRARSRLIEQLPYGYATIGLSSLLFVAWRVFDLGQPGAPDIVGWITAAAASWSGVLSLVLIGFLGSLLGAQLYFVVLLAVVALGFWPGVLSSAVSIVMAVAATYLAGRLMGRNLSNKILGFRAELVRKRLFRRGFFSIAMLRFAPISRFPTVGIAAAAADVDFRTYFVGSLAGLIPYMSILCIVAYGTASMLREPSVFHAGILVLAFAAVWMIVRSAIKSFEARENKRKRGLPTTRTGLR